MDSDGLRVIVGWTASHVSLHLGGKDFEETFAELDSPEDWSIRIALSPVDFILVRHALNSPLQAMVAVPFMETMHRHFATPDTIHAVPGLARRQSAAVV
jgi:hypothetical protein